MEKHNTDLRLFASLSSPRSSCSCSAFGTDQLQSAAGIIDECTLDRCSIRVAANGLSLCETCTSMSISFALRCEGDDGLADEMVFYNAGLGTVQGKSDGK